MSNQSIAQTVAVHFRTSPDDPHVETVLYALHGVALALDDEGLTVNDLDRRQMERIAGLTAAASVLTSWLTRRLDGSETVEAAPRPQPVAA